MTQAATTRPWITAGVAVLGAGAIAVTPVVTPLPDRTELFGLQTRAVQLTAGGDINFDGWTQLFTNTESSLGGLFDHVSGAPFPALQQLLVNQVDHIKDLLGGNFSDVVTNIEDNAKGAFAAPFTPFEPTTTPLPDYIYPSLDPTQGSISGTGCLLVFICTPIDLPSTHADLFSLLAGSSGLLNDLVPGLGSSAEGLLDFAGSPISGVLWGGLGVVASPLIQAYEDIQALITAVSGTSPDIDAVFTDLLNDPANILNAFLNGTTLPVDLLTNSGFDSIVGPLLENLGVPSTLVTPLLDVLHVNVDTPIAFGGLLSPGGSLFDALGIDATLSANVVAASFTGTLDMPALEVGPIGSLIELGQAIAAGIGWDDLASQPLADLFAGI